MNSEPLNEISIFTRDPRELPRPIHHIRHSESQEIGPHQTLSLLVP